MRGRPLGEVVFVRARRNILLEVELDIFSGVPNPTWILSPRQEATLYERLKADPKQISAATNLNTRLGLGYRGLIVRRIKTDNGPSDRRWPLGAHRCRTISSHRNAKKKLAADWLVNTQALKRRVEQTCRRWCRSHAGAPIAWSARSKEGQSQTDPKPSCRRYF
jgi:hypothetical protein